MALAQALDAAIMEKWGEDANVGALVFVADIAASVEGQYVNPIVYVANDPRVWVAQALISEAGERADKEVEAWSGQLGDFEDEEEDEEEDD